MGEEGVGVSRVKREKKKIRKRRNPRRIPVQSNQYVVIDLNHVRRIIA